jgi:hypothetical protein
MQLSAISRQLSALSCLRLPHRFVPAIPKLKADS